jgi:hypothetical protein
VKHEFAIRSQPLIKKRSGPLIVQEEFRHFEDRENGGKSFDLTTHEISICEIPTRSESSDRGGIRIVRLGALKYRHFGNREKRGAWKHKCLKPETPKS